MSGAQPSDMATAINKFITAVQLNQNIETVLEEIKYKINVSTPNLGHVPLALKLADHHIDHVKRLGVFWLDITLASLPIEVRDTGYDRVIFQSLMRIVTFDDGQLYNDCLKLLNRDFYHVLELQDEIMESLLKRIATCNDLQKKKLTVVHITNLIDSMEDNILKHSKQLLLFVDQAGFEGADDETLQLYDIMCRRLEDKVPKRP